MNNKYKTGNLFVIIFDNYGTKKHQVPVINYMDGRAKIKNYLKKYPKHSCILSRVVFNSKDDDKWGLSE